MQMQANGCFPSKKLASLFFQIKETITTLTFVIVFYMLIVFLYFFIFSFHMDYKPWRRTYNGMRSVDDLN